MRFLVSLGELVAVGVEGSCRTVAAWPVPRPLPGHQALHNVRRSAIEARTAALNQIYER